MRVPACSAILATTTMLSGAAFAQDSFTAVATMDATGTQLIDTRPYDTIQFTINGSGPFSITRDSQTAINGMFGDEHYGTLLYFNRGMDAFPGGATTFAGLTGAPNFAGQGNTTLGFPFTNGSLALEEGQYTLLVAPDHLDTGIEIFTTTFTFSGALLGWVSLGPDAEEELAALVAASGGAVRLVVQDAAGVARDLGAVSLATRDGRLELTRVATAEGGDQVVASTMSAPGMMGNVYTWAEITGFRSEEEGGPASIRGTGLQIGADMEIGPDMVAGLSLGYSDLSSEDGGFSQDGELVYLQPYFAYRAGEWGGTASLLYGRGQFDQSSGGGDGTGETELVAFTFEGGYDYALQDGYTVTPTLGLIHGREIVESTGGTLAGAGSETYRFTQGSIGARMTYDWADGTVFAGLHADYLTQDAGAVLTDDFLSEDGWTARVELGTSMDLANGLGLSTSVELSGLGGGAETLSGGLRIAFTF